MLLSSAFVHEDMDETTEKQTLHEQYLSDAFQQYVVVSATSVRRKYSETNERRMEEITGICSLDALVSFQVDWIYLLYAASN